MERCHSLLPGDVVQINPSSEGFFAGCFMVIDETRTWGVIGYVQMPSETRQDSPGPIAPLRMLWDEVEYIGHAEWVIAPDEDEYRDVSLEEEE